MLQSSPWTRALALLLLCRFGAAQTLVVGGKIVDVDGNSLAPAAAEVKATESRNLFSDETTQLTDAVIANLTSLEVSNITLFSFGDDDEVSEGGDLERRALFGRCKTYPGDLLYPGKLIWGLFDLLLGGALIKTVPFASVCYDDFGNYDAVKCGYITSNWNNNSYIHIEDPTSINALLFEGMNCIPPALNPGSTECRVGGLPSYVVEATNVAQIQLAVNFARNLNLRLVIKNTGHDFTAKSTGAGALSIWTHKLKNIQFVPEYDSHGYKGPAFKVGAGVQAYELYEAAHKRDVTVVGGEGETVGVMGGYIQGGGHSPLSGLYGMGSDSVLSFEVVTADGRFVTASKCSHPDLFWALRGGGGSTYGVVTSVTIKAYPKITVSTLSFSFMTGPDVSTEQYWAAVRAYFEGFVGYAVDNANYGYFNMVPLGPGALLFSMAPWFAPDMTESELRDLVAPLFAKFDAIGIQYEPVFHEFDNYYDAWRASFPLEQWGSTAVRTASRLFPRSSWEDITKFNDTFDTIKSTVEDGTLVLAFNIAAAPDRYPDTAVNPAWRETVLHAIVGSAWDPTADESVKKAASDRLTFDWMERWREVSPDAGAYMSEADYIEPNFTQSFWGIKYPKALQIKKRYDPLDVFYAHNAVGSEFWEMSEFIFGNLPSQNSKLCRKK